MEWQEIYGNWVLVPPQPTAIIHFLGGAFVATAPQLTYRTLLEFLANQGYAIVATPFVNTMDHTTIAQRTLRLGNLAIEHLQIDILRQQLPVYGMGHSMGCKLHLLIGSLFPQERAGNILISFNNYPARRSIPMLDQLGELSRLGTQWMTQITNQFSAQLKDLPLPQLAAFDVEFTPSPEETNRLIAKHYQVKHNLLVKFTSDDIDQTKPLTLALNERFPETTHLKILRGNHLTPLGQDVQWQTSSEFSPFDAIGQFFRQELTRDLNQLKRTLLYWLDPIYSD
ncbi:DUF1350 family protein [Leptolyngbya sp. FACHB-711]|uniref:DUF1350 family protein n=1 Tax=unclassified Leptolyngbya TaxID=2650499 RepID=UPI0016822A34|nr:DUF1350 family protein [Leptolyngbya sp. FACHB-711]MBD1850823.1 DUF1350 family protein [Cyanobacteria bacterium FACHB-502]MBD2023517.1 DUF1350 family protein [Leptolyngbya sp. FACHB-711]